MLSGVDLLYCYPFGEVTNDKGLQLDLSCPHFPAFSFCKSSFSSSEQRISIHVPVEGWLDISTGSRRVSTRIYLGQASVEPLWQREERKKEVTCILKEAVR